MRLPRCTRSLAVALGTLALVLSAAAPALAQDFCLITGVRTSCKPSQWCGPGPSENYTYTWSGPNGFTATSTCIDVSVTGTYTLTVRRNSDGATETCSADFTLTTGTVPCDISGPSTVCEGETAELCGPTGEFTYRWEGPGGFTATSRCITVSVAGVYTLVVTNPVSTCEATCTHELKVEDCEPPPPSGENCPRTVGFWGAQCDQKDNGSTKFTKDEVQSIASCVDDRSDLFTWTSDSNPFIDFDLFCRNINPPKPMDQREQARRQFAALLANACTGALGLIANNGDEIGLDLDTPVTCGGGTTTIGDLIDDVDDALIDLQDDDLEDQDTKDAYGRIITCLDNINNGRGIGVVCEKETDGGSKSAMLGIEGVELYRPWPNPTTGTMQMSFAVARSGDAAELSVYDLAGRLQKTLVRGELEAGVHTVGWDGTDGTGARARAGVYFIRGRVSSTKVNTQVILVR